MPPALLEPRLAFDAISDADLLALARMFDDAALARLWDISLDKLAGRIRRVRHEADARAAAPPPSRPDKSLDIFYVKERVGAMLQPYLENPEAFASQRDMEKTLALTIQYTELIEKTWKIVQERMQARDISNALIDAISDCPDRLKILSRWQSNKALQEFMKG